MYLGIFTAFLLLFGASTCTKDCRDVVDMKLHPIDCCTYPILFEDPQLTRTCEQQCKSSPSKHYCPRVCFLKDLDIYADGKLKTESIKNLFTTGSSENSERGNVGENWKDIVEESIKTCLTEHEIHETIEEENISMVVFDLMNCIRRHNFVACPDMNDSKECADMKDAIKHCDKSTEKMLFGVFHEERKSDKLKGGQVAVERGNAGARH